MNVVVLSGNLARDPEVRFTPKGQAVAEFTVCVSKRWVTETGEQKERTTFVSCLCWGKRGEAFAEHHRKGARALVRGELVQDSWEDKTTGKKQTKTRVEVTDWEFATQRDAATSSVKGATTPSQRPAEGGDSRRRVATPQQGEQAAPSTDAGAEEEDDVPF